MASYEDRLIALGGKRWQKGDMDRIYFDRLPAWYGLKVSRRSSTGSIQSATLDGEKVSNTQARKILAALDPVKVWYDVRARKFQHRAPNAPGEEAAKIVLASIKARAGAPPGAPGAPLAKVSQEGKRQGAKASEAIRKAVKREPKGRTARAVAGLPPLPRKTAPPKPLTRRSTVGSLCARVR